MTTIATVATQDGLQAAGPATDPTGEAGAEFTALLCLATGATAPPPAATPPSPDLPPAADPSLQNAGLDVLPAGNVVPLPNPLAQGLARAPDAASPRAASSRAESLVPPRLGLTAMPAGCLVQTATDPGATPDAGPRGPAAVLPAAASPVAVAVLGALQAGRLRDTPPVTTPPGGTAVPSPAPLAATLARLADVVQEVAGSTVATDTESASDDALTDVAGQPTGTGQSVRDSGATSAHARVLPGTVGTPPWREALGTELRLMLERGVGAATLRLSPEHLGPLEVRIEFDDDGAKVWFTASHADTRAALAEALPRLRDMFASVGVNLGEAGVQRDLPGEAGRREGAWRGAGADGPDAVPDTRVIVARLDPSRGMVDEYA
jgi:flagellar hook-length control protein FliK